MARLCSAWKQEPQIAITLADYILAWQTCLPRFNTDWLCIFDQQIGAHLISEISLYVNTSSTPSASGYASSEYAEALTEIGRPRLLKSSGCWVLERAIPGSSYLDIMGCYPLCDCRDGEHLATDLAELGQEFICFSAVLDPFGEYDPDALATWFPERAIAFKEHFVVDLTVPYDQSVCAHHRRNARRALHDVTVEHLPKPQDYAQQWCQLYANLIRRHAIRGFAAFSESSLVKQLNVPGTVVFRAVRNGETVGMVIWYVSGEVGYYHLGAYSELGYELRSAFALFWISIDYFASGGLRWLNLGGGAGISNKQEDGLSRFKRGWTTCTRTAFFCGKVLNQTRYQELVDQSNTRDTTFFPAYRAADFP